MAATYRALGLFCGLLTIPVTLMGLSAWNVTVLIVLGVASFVCAFWQESGDARPSTRHDQSDVAAPVALG